MLLVALDLVSPLGFFHLGLNSTLTRIWTSDHPPFLQGLSLFSRICIAFFHLSYATDSGLCVLSRYKASSHSIRLVFHLLLCVRTVSPALHHLPLLLKRLGHGPSRTQASYLSFH